MAGYDIGAELYGQISAEFERLLTARDTSLPKDDRRVNMALGDKYAKTVGECLAQAIAKCVDPEALPDGKLYYNIAEKILDPTLRENHRLVNDYCAEIQERINERQGLRIAPQTAKYPEEKAHSLINAAAHEEDEGKRARILDDSVRNITDSFYADNVKANADVRSQAGLSTYIVREGGSKCCDWCAALEGRYTYGEEPKDVYRRHDNCSCTVVYESSRGRQNVWSKQNWSAEQEQKYLELRDELKAKKMTAAPDVKKPVRLTEKEVQAIINKVGGLTFGRYSDILSLSDSSSIYKFVGEKAVNDVPLMQIFGERIETDPIKRANDQILNVLHKRASEDLLSFIRADEQACLANDPNYEPGVEYSIVFDENMRPIKGREKPQKYWQGNCLIPPVDEKFHAFHNHGSNGFLAYSDLRGFSKEKNMISLTAQGVNGSSKSVVYKEKNYSEDDYKLFLLEKGEEPFYVFKGEEITLDTPKARKAEIYQQLSDDEKAVFEKAYTDKTMECINGGERYGVRYFK